MPTTDALTHLDDAICLWLTDRTNGHPCNSSHLNALATPLTRPGRESWRLIDRRLQALRESGRISYVGKRKQDHGWWVSCQAATPPRIQAAKQPTPRHLCPCSNPLATH